MCTYLPSVKGVRTCPQYGAPCTYMPTVKGVVYGLAHSKGRCNVHMLLCTYMPTVKGAVYVHMLLCTYMLTVKGRRAFTGSTQAGRCHTT